MSIHDGKRRRMLKREIDDTMKLSEYAMTIGHTKKNVSGKSCTLSIFRLFFLSMPATACQPTGTVPACSHGITEAIKAVREELS